MSYRITGLDGAQFAHLYGLSDEALAAHGATRIVVDARPGYPDRIGLRDLERGETALLLNYTHQPADTPYRASHAIFVHEGAGARYDRSGEIPEVMRIRMLSLRAFGADHLMRDADLVDGRHVERLIARLLDDPETAYIHAHYAKRGCYAARIDRGG